MDAHRVHVASVEGAVDVGGVALATGLMGSVMNVFALLSVLLLPFIHTRATLLL